MSLGGCVLEPDMPWPTRWTTAYPRPSGPWTVAGGGSWGLLEPETAAVSEVHPADDHQLPALGRTLSVGGILLGYRAERRAVAATAAGFVKVVRPSRVQRLVAGHELLAGDRGPSVPTVRSVDPDGAITLEAVPGNSLNVLLTDRYLTESVSHEALRTMDLVAESVAALHSVHPTPDLPDRARDDPGSWCDVVARAEPGVAALYRDFAERLPDIGRPAGPVVVHGDLHDKNVIVNGDSVSLIDLDGVSAGCAEEDLANLAVHLQLRAMQVGADGPIGECLASRLYVAYRRLRPYDPQLAAQLERHVWFRLACLYRFRRSGRHLAVAMLANAVRGLPSGPVGMDRRMGTRERLRVDVAAASRRL